MFCISLCKFSCLLWSLEDQEFLDISNEFHFCVLRLVSTQRINNSLSEFVAGWDNHNIDSDIDWESPTVTEYVNYCY